MGEIVSGVRDAGMIYSKALFYASLQKSAFYAYLIRL